MKLLILSAVVLAGISISFDHPTTRTDGEALPNSEIAGFEMYINGVKHPTLIPNSTSSVDYPTISGGNFKMTTVDTDGRVSAFSEEIFKGIPTTTTTSTTQIGSTTTTTRPTTPGQDLDPSNWTVKYASSFELENWHMPPECLYNRDAPCGDAPIWHSRYSPTEALPPHEIQIALNEYYYANSIKIQPRPGGGNGTMKGYKIYTSLSGRTWVPVAEGELPAGDQIHTIPFDRNRRIGYIKLVCLSEQDGGNQCAIDELYLMGAEIISTQPPNAPTQMEMQ